MIRSACESDAVAIATIYNHYVEHTPITFEMEAVSNEQMAERILLCLQHPLPWLVFEKESQVIGYCYASPWKSRPAYQHAVEASVYLAPDQTGQGVGSALLSSLILSLQAKRYHTLICGIALPNSASVALHEKFGLKQVAHFQEVGRKFDRWIDVGYWHCLLEKAINLKSDEDLR